MARIHFHDFHPCPADLRAEVIAGLGATTKALSPKFFYDSEGSRLFEHICRQPEYYLTRTELRILRACARDIAALLEHKSCLVELGSGSGLKARLLIDHLHPIVFAPIDIAREPLQRSAREMASLYSWLEIHSVCTDYCQPFPLGIFPSHAANLVFFPGSTLGNFEPAEAMTFLRSLRDLTGDGALLIGIDLKKDTARLEAAYNDAAGVTAAFNLNLLARLERELGAGLDRSGFHHHAFYDERAGRIEMHLISRRRQVITVGEHAFTLESGESILTEYSYKYGVGEFADLARSAGYLVQQVWTDPESLFSLHLLRPA